ncbi:hypothetical protein TNCV_1947311 [Trichonephila clavipes]|nr:hypothetical protein TNCV_1947311 [Trichonephila clavipes]
MKSRIYESVAGFSRMSLKTCLPASSWIGLSLIEEDLHETVTMAMQRVVNGSRKGEEQMTFRTTSFANLTRTFDGKANVPRILHSKKIYPVK